MGSGLDFLKELRVTSSVPVIALTEKKEDSDIVTGYDSGCDDYVPKPYTFPVLYARIESLMRHITTMPDYLEKDALKLDPLVGQAFLNGEDLMLSQKEFSLLLFFVQNEGKTMSAEYIYGKVWNAPIGNNNSALQTRISVIRQKLSDGKFPYTVRNIYGKGYCFEKI